jgi:hypothetical protein
MRDTIRKSSNRYAKKGNRQPPKFEDRVRFNWGFHDGTGDANGGKVRDVRGHFDPVYADGYNRGVETFRTTGKRPETSEPAWQARTSERAATAALGALRPDNRVVRV